jgi:hypothetical protein
MDHCSVNHRLTTSCEVVRSIKRGEDIDRVLRKIGLTESTWEDVKIKYLKLSAGGI